MLSETVKQIKDAEEKANSIRSKAAEDAKKLLQEARNGGENLVKEALSNAAASEKAAAEKAEKAAQAVIAEEKLRSDDMCRSFASTAVARTDKALKVIIGGINAQWQ